MGNPEHVINTQPNANGADIYWQKAKGYIAATAIRVRRQHNDP